MEIRGKGMPKGRRCYGHLGGKLGELLLVRFVELGWLELEEGKSTVYIVTDKGREEFEKLGVKLD